MNRNIIVIALSAMPLFAFGDCVDDFVDALPPATNSGAGASNTHTPTGCFLDHKRLAIIDQSTGNQVDKGERKIYSGRTFEIEKKFKMTGSDAEDCRVEDDLQTVETAFYVSLNDSPLQLIRDSNGERYQKTQMYNLSEGSEHTESVFHTITGLTAGDKVTYVACHDVNEDLNQPVRDDCEDEVLTVVAPPIEGAHETVGRDYFKGYAIDHDLPQGGLTINVYVDEEGGTPDYTTTTTHYRNDERGVHEWYWAVPDVLRDGDEHTYYFEAVNVGPGVNKELKFESTGSYGVDYTIAASQGTIVPLYRFYSSELECHFYTISESEKDDVVNGVHGTHWGIEHTEGWVLSAQEPGSVPVYRFWQRYNVLNDKVGCHFFTNSETERTTLLGETLPNTTDIPAQFRGGDRWREEGVGGIGFYAYPSPRLGTVWMKRAKKESNKAHFFSIGTSEYQNAIAGDYVEEGNAFTAFPALPAVPAPVPQAPAIVKVATNVSLEVGAGFVADRVFDERSSYVLGETIYTHVMGDVNVDHTWKLKMSQGGVVVKEVNSPLTQDDIRSDHSIFYAPTSIGSYTIEASINMGHGFVSQGTVVVNVGAAPVPPVACSIAPNHSFESSAWSDQSWGNSTRSIATAAEASEGSQSGLATISSYTDGQVKMVSPDISVTGGTTYNLSLFAKGSVTNAYVQPISYDSSGNAVGFGGYMGLGLSGGWQEFTGIVDIPANAVTLKLEVRAESDGDLYVDDVWVNVTSRDASCSAGGNSGGTGSSTTSIPNGSFESGVSTNWSDHTWGSSSHTITSSSEASDGAQSAKIDVSSYTDGQVKLVSDAITVTGDQTYSLSIDAKGTATTAYVQPISYDSSGNAIGYGGWTGLSMGSSWQTSTNSITVPSDAVTLKLEIRIESQGEVFVDYVDFQ